MASYTTNLNLKKPAGSENVAIGDINNNMDTIDQAYGTLNSNKLDKSVYNSRIITDMTRTNNDYTFAIPNTIVALDAYVFIGRTFGNAGYNGAGIIDLIMIGYDTSEAGVFHINSSTVIDSVSVSGQNIILHTNT